MTLHSGLSSVKSYSFRIRSLWFTVSYATDRSTNAAPVMHIGNHASLVAILDVLSQVKELAAA